MKVFEIGGLYAANIGNGKYSIVKILALDEKGVHARCYSNVFSAMPLKLNETLLSIDGPYCGRYRVSGFGHAAVSFETLAHWHLKLVKQSVVVESELSGYRLWLSLSTGNYF